ncbi:hypothetical protein EYF80_037519 [Liparis tanakae]|uniref:Uncharacterized protein n=1 Tax=Liparis tanakae TaxID=230148 RepID=A0A4Z2GHZ9_9TELE|nr:hypothetical protein EYF80_037519 [Liparis tanakae]
MQQRTREPFHVAGECRQPSFCGSPGLHMSPRRLNPHKGRITHLYMVRPETTNDSGPREEDLPDVLDYFYTLASVFTTGRPSRVASLYGRDNHSNVSPRRNYNWAWARVYLVHTVERAFKDEDCNSAARGGGIRKQLDGAVGGGGGSRRAALRPSRLACHTD